MKVLSKIVFYLLQDGCTYIWGTYVRPVNFFDSLQVKSGWLDVGFKPRYKWLLSPMSLQVCGCAQ